ncbi:MAG TPA: hypothetical protein VEL31_03810 [Ktedonobacteraceae bacterium]|nr:hypothetical protein [Ktedonobacteraceae bacterium]
MSGFTSAQHTIASEVTEHVARRAIAESTYTRLCRSLYDYGFGTIGFLELVARFEEILSVESPQI